MRFSGNVIVLFCGFGIPHTEEDCSDYSSNTSHLSFFNKNFGLGEFSFLGIQAPPGEQKIIIFTERQCNEYCNFTR